MRSKWKFGGEILRCLKKKQKALSNLCVLLRNFGPRPIFKSSRDISSQEFFQIISCISPVLLESDVGNDLGPLPKETQRQVIAIFNDLEVSFYDLFSLAKAFEDNGELEINGLVEGMAVLELQRFYQVRGRSVEGEIFGTQSLGVRPPDMLFFNTGLAEIERHLHGTERSILGQASIVTDILQCLNHICFEAHTLFQFDMSKLDIAQMREKALLQQSASEDKPMSIGAMVNHILEYKASLAAQGLESRIDLLAALFIVANAVTLGVEITTSTKDDKDIAFYLVNLVFTVVFSTELILRLTLRANVLDLQVEREWVSDDTDRQVDGEQDGYFYSMKSIEALRRRTLFGIFPPCPRRGCTQVCRMAPEFLTDPFTFFDAVIVLLSIMDALVLFILSAAAGFSKIRLLGLLRVLRLVRLLKLVRVLRLLPGLQKIVYVVLDASKLIRRQICLMLILCYTFGVLMEFVIDKERASPELNYYFNGILTGTITAFQLMIFDEWDIIMDVTSKEFPELVILVEIPLMIAGVMFINSVVGLFCTAAVSLVQQKQGTRRQRGYLTILQAMGELGTLLRTELTTHVVTQEMLETALGMKFRPKRKHAGRDGREATLNDRRQAESISSVNLRASSPDFIDKLRHILCKADMVPLLWKQIYEKIDYERRGYISVDLLAVGAILLRVDSEQVDIFAASTALRQVRQKVRELHKLESRVHHDLEVVVRMTNSLCHRNEDDCRVGEVRDLWSLSDKTVEAVKGLRRVLEVGTHDQMAYRNVKIKAERGRGKLRQVDEHYDHAGNPVFLLEGHATRFRRDLQIGDDILVEMDMPQHHEHKRHASQVVDRSAGLGSRSSIFTTTNSLITAASSMMFDSKSTMLGSVKSLMSAGSSAPVEQASRKAILEGPHQQSSYAPARVRMITDDTSIMVAPDERTWTKHNLHWCSYMILRKDTVKRMGKEDRSDASETYVNSAPVSYQPGNAAELFQWEVESAQKNEQILKTLEMDIQENMERINSGKDFSSDSTAKMLIGKKVVDIMRKEKELLTKEYAAFCEVFVGLRDRSYLMMAFRGWKVETSIKEDMITGRPAWRGGKGSYPSKSPVVVPSHGTSSQSARETALEALKRLTERTRTLHSKAGPGREGRDGRVGLGKDGTEGPGEEAASSPPMANDELQPTGSGAELDKVDKPPNSERRDLPTEMRARASGKSRPQPPSNSYDFSDEEDPEVNPTSVEMIETADSRRSIEVVGSADKPEEPKKLTLWW